MHLQRLYAFLVIFLISLREGVGEEDKSNINLVEFPKPDTRNRALQTRFWVSHFQHSLISTIHPPL
jgi:hypothetical protein